MGFTSFLKLNTRLIRMAVPCALYVRAPIAALRDMVRHSRHNNARYSRR